MFKKDQIAGLMKKAQEMQANMQKAQEELMNAEVTGESGAGLVKVTMNGKYRIKQIKLDESLLKEDKEIMEDLIVAALNATADKVESMSAEKMSSLTGGMGLPAGMKLPF